MTRDLSVVTVVEKLQQVLFDLVSLAKREGEEFQGVVLDDIPLFYREEDETRWRITVEKIVAHTKTGKTLTDGDLQALADEAEEGYDVEHLQEKFVEGFEEGRVE